MSRATAILMCLGIFGLLILTAFTEPRINAPFDTTRIWVHGASTIVLALSLIAYCGFAALHSTQHITCPLERTTWLLLTIGLNVLGSCIYYCSLYQRFRQAGHGSLISHEKTGNKKDNEQRGSRA